jgi:hypothetical protein
VPFQVFADESGGKGHTKLFVMAALAAEAEAWAAFSDEWRACLAEAPAIRIFKMQEAAGRPSGQFRGWSTQARDAKLLKLVRIINRYAEASFYSALDLDAHAKTWAKALPKPMSDPYFYPYQNTITASCVHLWDAGLRERFEIIFDENVIFGPRARLWYPLMREVVKRKEPDAYPILPIDPVFRPDDEFMPLQACDMFAWCIRNGTEKPEDESLNWLIPELQNVVVSDYSQFYDEARMRAVLKQSDEIFEDKELLRDLYSSLPPSWRGRQP